MINITKGMADAAESIHANFQEIKISAGSNANGEWVQFGEFFKVAYGTMTFTKGSGNYAVGNEIVFDIELPIEFANGKVFLQPIAYNGVGSFAMYDLETHLINETAGSIVIRRIDSGVNSIDLQFLVVGV